jgi:hypothetical protein
MSGPMRGTRARLACLSLSLLLFGGIRWAAAQDDFYRGKTVRIVVGYSAGGGFDTYSRAIARHLAKHIPGKPAVIVENMPGAAWSRPIRSTRCLLRRRPSACGCFGRRSSRP